MARMPAFCESCGNVSPFPMEIQNATHITFGRTATRCPKCGGRAYVPDGVYDIVGDTLTVLQAPERSIQDLKRFAEILRAARNSPEAADDLEEKIKAEVPAFASLLEKWKPKTAGDRYSLVALLLIAAGLVLQVRESKSPATVTVEQVIENTYVQAQAAAPPAQANPKKVGRNEPCTCGSGKKYKHCCLNKKAG